MKNSTLKKKLLNRKLTIGSWISIPHPSVVEIMASFDFEWLVIDMEHSATNLETCMQAIQIIQAAGLDPLVRVPENEGILIKKAMDAGATGVIVPMIKNEEDAQKAVSFVKYPPLGIRGVGLYRAQGYGKSFHKYKDWVAKSSVVIIQVEHIEAVKNLEKILQVDGVDGILIGPYDLSASMGRPGEFTHPDMLKALEHIEKVTKNNLKPLGLHVIPPKGEELNKRIGQGYNFLAFSIDFLFLGDSIRQSMDSIKKDV